VAQAQGTGGLNACAAGAILRGCRPSQTTRDFDHINENMPAASMRSRLRYFFLNSTLLNSAFN
jgi:hypothetical protein